jgi:hypothetical protein
MEGARYSETLVRISRINGTTSQVPLSQYRCEDLRYHKTTLLRKTEML